MSYRFIRHLPYFRTRDITYHYTMLHFITCPITGIIFHHMSWHCLTSNGNIFKYMSMMSWHYTFHKMSCHLITWHYSYLHFIGYHYMALHFIIYNHITWHYISSRANTLRDIIFHHVPIHYVSNVTLASVGVTPRIFPTFTIA